MSFFAQRSKIEELRRERDQRLADLRLFAKASAASAERIDVREQIRANPAAALGVAAASGFFASWIVGSTRLRHVAEAVIVSQARKHIRRFVNTELSDLVSKFNGH